MEGDGFVINSYGHPDYLRYVEGNRRLTLAYDIVDETAQRGRRFFIFRTFGTHVKVPAELTWDDGTALEGREAATVLDRICRTFEQYKKRPCRTVVDNALYEQLEAVQREISARRKGYSPAPGE
jgi:hypothetical protein